MSVRLHAERDLEGAVSRILTDVVALHGAEFGDAQLAVEDNLYLVDQRGFDPAFLAEFKVVSVSASTVCARAFRARRSVLVEDVNEDRDFEPYRASARHAGFRAVQSTPLVGADGSCIGVVSTHFANPHRPTHIEMQTLEEYSRLAADFLLRLAPAEQFASIVRSLNEALCQRCAR